MIRSDEEIALMREAGKVVAEIHREIKKAIAPGVKTIELDEISREVLKRRGARSNFLGYHGYPATICTSPNNVIVHGIPGEYVLKEGDLISVDCGAIVEGYHGDAAFSVGVGEVSKEVEDLIRVTEKSLYIGIDQMKPGNHLFDIGQAIEQFVLKHGYSVVRDYVGHAIGTAMHEEPQVPNYWPGRPGPVLKAGNVFAIEPMVNMGSEKTILLSDNWSVVTADGSLSAHFEHTVAILDNGPEILTA